jgi:hypothetical protein
MNRCCKGNPKPNSEEEEEDNTEEPTPVLFGLNSEPNVRGGRIKRSYRQKKLKLK